MEAHPFAAPLSRGRIADRILDDLRNRIASGELARGSRLPAERELAGQYGVSGATVREAVRGLSAMGFLDVRHGSGAYVTAGNDRLLASSLGTLIQLAEVSLADVVGILAVLHAHAAELVVEHATDADIAALDAGIEALATTQTADALAEALMRFLRALAAATHNPLLAALCNFLSQLQIGLALELSRRSDEQWRKMTGAFREDRVAIVAALRRRDRAQTVEAMNRYQATATRLIAQLPYGKRKRIPSAPLAGVLTAIRDTRRSPP